jgi:sugar (pentulose or hexulose) kinase
MKGKSNWIIQNEPEIWKRTHKYLLLSGFINFRLTGNFVDSTACQIAHIPFDYKNQCWPSSMDFKWRVFGINRNMLPDLIPAGGVLGEISKKASKETGLPEGLVVIAGGSDKGCETLGTGCVDETSANISFGTTATIQTTTSKYIEPIKFLPPYPAIAKGTYNPEIEIFRGYWMISWFKKEFAEREMLEAAKKKIAPEVLLDKRLSEVPAGCQGLMLQPLWSPDILNPEAKGMILGFGDVHTRIHIYRAIIEGINYALLEGAEKIEKKTGKTIDWISVSGGGASSDAVCQITADMFNRPIHKPSTHETSGLGAAIIGFVGIKVYNSYPEAVSKMVHYKQVYQPQKANAKIYHELYRDVYVKLYSRMKPFYKSIQKITGYPEM